MRERFIERLEHYHHNHPQESTPLCYLNFVKSHPNPFSQGLKVGHITASAWLVNQQGSHVLLTHHKRLNIWVQLGGHIDDDEEVLAAALREAQEESGILEIYPLSSEIFDLDIHLIPERKKGNIIEAAHHHYDAALPLK
ncbi:MAG: NUDIX domain-containing protein [Deinococcales bacterium]